MNKISNFSGVFAFLSMLILGSCSQSPNGYTVKGTIKGIDSGMVKLVQFHQNARTSTTIDSATVSHGAFIVEGKIESPEMMSLVLEPGNWSIPVFMENSAITVEADTTGSEYFDWTAYEGGSKGARINDYSITGSASQEEWMQYQDDPSLNIYKPVFTQLNKEYEDVKDNKEAAYKVKEEMDSLRTLLYALRKNWVDSFITANPSSAAGAYMLNQYYLYHEDLPLIEMKSLMAKFTGPAQSTVYFDMLSEAVKDREALQPGNTAPDFTALKRDSSEFTLSSLRGKTVMLDFWASWCVPCRKSIPHWKEVYAKYHPQGFEMVSITNDSRWSDWFRALDDEQMAWIQVADDFPVKNMPARIAELYMIPYLPTYVLLDKEGKIILHNASEQEISEKLKEIYE